MLDYLSVCCAGKVVTVTLVRWNEGLEVGVRGRKIRKQRSREEEKKGRYASWVGGRRQKGRVTDKQEKR